MNERKLTDAALLLPVLAALLFLPTVLKLVSGQRWVADLPSLPTFLFLVWLVLIGAALALARRLAHLSRDGADGSEP